MGRTHNVSSLGLVLSANPNRCPCHQDKGTGKGRLPVQVGGTYNVLHLAWPSQPYIMDVLERIHNFQVSRFVQCVQEHSHTVTSHANSITLNSGNVNPALLNLTIVEPEVKCFSATIG